MRQRAGTLGALLVAIMMIAGVAVAAHLIPSRTDVQPVLSFADENPTGGESVLTRTSGMVLVTVEAAELTPGNAYTLWWVVFNNPRACSDRECGEDDIFNEDGSLNVEGVQAAQIGVGHATGNVARADGTTEFGGRLKVNDTSGDHQIVFPAGLSGEALLTVSGSDAEVHVVVQTHGQARRGDELLDQLTFFQAGCTPTCEDIQFAVHKP